ncbi:phenylalanyl-tRNA synthetase domain protein [Gracilibacillus boraciitolerans JCM 21714]|uniref:Phenylalanyl-tRNA synthetase domain protein n=1 Tax=Gracilibacillus boraciitolerans JCM 21714 TaxID=1298598 RepID=W4VHM2_9BACI|nr:phenylalanyl-tRNA synthetase domain protein [Gracilibacillus boraciitolerans JCM 21714]
MFVYYNEKGIGDVLLFPMKNSNKISFERKQDIVTLFDEVTKETVGFNIFNASTYFKDLSTGKMKLTEKLLAELNEAFEKNNTKKIDLDVTAKFVVGFVEKFKPMKMLINFECVKSTLKMIGCKLFVVHQISIKVKKW